MDLENLEFPFCFSFHCLWLWMVFLRKYPYLCHRGLLHLSFLQTKKNTCYAVHEQQSDYFSFFLSLFFLFTIFYDFTLTNMKEEATHGIVWQRGLGWVNLSHAPPPRNNLPDVSICSCLKFLFPLGTRVLSFPQEKNWQLAIYLESIMPWYNNQSSSRLDKDVYISTARG